MELERQPTKCATKISTVANIVKSGIANYLQLSSTKVHNVARNRYKLAQIWPRKESITNDHFAREIYAVANSRRLRTEV